MKALIARPENAKCADCDSKFIKQADINYGVFLCRECGDGHKSKLDGLCKIVDVNTSWKPEWIALFAQVGGNSRINEEHYEMNIHDYDGRKRGTCSTRFIYDKYKWRFFTDHKDWLPKLKAGTSVARQEVKTQPKAVPAPQASTSNNNQDWGAFTTAAPAAAPVATPAPAVDPFGMGNASQPASADPFGGFGDFNISSNNSTSNTASSTPNNNNNNNVFDFGNTNTTTTSSNSQVDVSALFSNTSSNNNNNNSNNNNNGSQRKLGNNAFFDLGLGNNNNKPLNATPMALGGMSGGGMRGPSNNNNNNMLNRGGLGMGGMNMNNNQNRGAMGSNNMGMGMNMNMNMNMNMHRNMNMNMNRGNNMMGNNNMNRGNMGMGMGNNNMNNMNNMNRGNNMGGMNMNVNRGPSVNLNNMGNLSLTNKKKTNAFADLGF